MRPLVLELSLLGQFDNAIVHTVFGGPIFAMLLGENLAVTPSVLRVHSGHGFVSAILVGLSARSGDSTSTSMSVLGEPRGDAAGFSKEA